MCHLQSKAGNAFFTCMNEWVTKITIFQFSSAYRKTQNKQSRTYTHSRTQIWTVNLHWTNLGPGIHAWAPLYLPAKDPESLPHKTLCKTGANENPTAASGAAKR